MSVNVVFIVDLVLINQRYLKSRPSVRIRKRRSARRYKNEDQQPWAKFSYTETLSRLSTDLRITKKYFTLSGYVPENSRYYPSTPTNIKFKQKLNYEVHLLV